MIKKTFLLSTLTFIPLLLSAHGSHGSGVIAGFTHPIFGVDHLIAILGTGILGYLLNPSKWYIPLLSFLFLMIIGGILSVGKEATLLIEKIIAFSVFSIGLIIAFRVKLNLGLSILILGIFGFFHGYAHGAEMPESNTMLKYISGYSLGTILAGTVGMVVGRLVDLKEKREAYVGILGGVICGCGVMILLG